jgi:dTMP kinase
MPQGRLIAFEGGEACGKSTQAARLAQRLGALLTREPGGTELGHGLRQMLLHGGDIDPRTETLMMLADRAHHVETVVMPALLGGREVVTDRFSHSTLAYQGYGRGLDIDDLRRMCSWASRGLWPDVVVLLTVPADVALARSVEGPDRLEAAGADFHRRVGEAFTAMAKEDASRWLVIDGVGTVDEVSARIDVAYDDWASRRQLHPVRGLGW